MARLLFSLSLLLVLVEDELALLSRAMEVAMDGTYKAEEVVDDTTEDAVAVAPAPWSCQLMCLIVFLDCRLRRIDLSCWGGRADCLKEVNEEAQSLLLPVVLVLLLLVLLFVVVVSEVVVEADVAMQMGPRCFCSTRRIDRSRSFV